MMHRVLAGLLAVALLLGLGACAGVHNLLDSLAGGATEATAAVESSLQLEADAILLEAEATYSNTFLGVGLRVPAGWWQYYRTAENFNEHPATTADTSTLDIYMESGYRYIDLAGFASLQDSSRDNHISLSLYAERIDDLDGLEAYVQEYVDYWVTPVEGYEAFTLERSFTADIGGRPFEARLLRVPDTGRDYYLLGLFCRLESGYFLAVEADYWSTNTEAEATILENLDSNLTLTDA